MRDVRPLMMEIKGFTPGTRGLMIFIKGWMKILQKWTALKQTVMKPHFF
jgi:hypothetical protein